MSSQLPNITGSVHVISESFNGYGWTGGCFGRGWGHHAGATPSRVDGSDCGTFNLDASRCSTLYKNDVNSVFGDSIAMNMFIKAKLA